ncbi:hypothetical protein, partial [Pectobacterium versatile]|uniref:hypothetical protein n=1 Tax=Pectobacterium versatile TaxID=2488639 RepID=UPI001C8DA617
AFTSNSQVGKAREYFSPTRQHLPKYGAGLLGLIFWGSLSPSGRRRRRCKMPLAFYYGGLRATPFGPSQATL